MKNKLDPFAQLLIWLTVLIGSLILVAIGSNLVIAEPKPEIEVVCVEWKPLYHKDRYSDKEHFVLASCQEWEVTGL